LTVIGRHRPRCIALSIWIAWNSRILSKSGGNAASGDDWNHFTLTASGRRKDYVEAVPVLIDMRAGAKLQLERNHDAIADFLHLHIVKAITMKAGLRKRKLGERNLHIKVIAAAERLVIIQSEV
jgi:hypothetical protein